jgi:hypothetical protein
VTEIDTNADLAKDHELAGSVVRVGKQWSVVKSNSPVSLIIWGRITDEGAKVEILDHYGAAPDARTAQK